MKAVQLHGRETPAQCIEVGKQIRWVIKAFGAGDENLPRADQYGTDLILLDAPNPGSGKVFDWSLAGDAPDSVRLILAGGLTPENVAAAVKRCSRGASTCRAASRARRARRMRWR